MQPCSQKMRNYLTRQEVARRLERSFDFVRNEIRRGRMAHHKFGSKVFVHISDFADYVARSRTPSAAEKEAKKRRMEAALR
jgi:excisionase family DNA binding protein